MEVVGPNWLVMACLPVLPFLVVASVGVTELGRLRTIPGGPVCSAFLATRPIRTAEMVQAKLLISALGVLILWGVMALAGLGWAVCMGEIGEMANRLVTITGSAPAAVGALVGGAALLAVVSWLALIRNLWIGAMGRPLLETAPMFLGMTFWIGVLFVAATWRNEWWPLLEVVLGVALMGKALAVGWVVRRLQREQLVADRTLGCAIAAWVLLAAVVECVVLGVFSGGFLLLAGAVLLLPLARPLAAPLALAHGRAR